MNLRSPTSGKERVMKRIAPLILCMVAAGAPASPLSDSVRSQAGARIVQSIRPDWAEGDWLVTAVTQTPAVEVTEDGANIQIANGLVSRRFFVGDNAACCSFRNRKTEFVRALNPEAQARVNGKWFNIGGGGHMFDPLTGRRGIEGKDITRAFSNSYFPGTFGVQGWQSGWSLYDAENLMAKAVGWEATFKLSVSQGTIDMTGEKESIFAAFRAWQLARELQVFSKEQKAVQQDPGMKHHIEQTGGKSFVLYPVQQLVAEGNTPASLLVKNPYQAQPLDCAIQFLTQADGATITLPGGRRLQCPVKLDRNQFVICKGDRAYVADGNRKRLGELALGGAASVPAGDSTVSVRLAGGSPAHVRLTVWARGAGERLGK
jgi:hypothetical protein